MEKQTETAAPCVPPRYRHELKYSVSYADFMAIRGRLRAVMKPDPHTDESGRYLIRSVYFDNYGDKALKEKINGAPQREKFRIRYYNDDISKLTLEKKIKHGSLCMKCSEMLSSEDCRRILGGETDKISPDGKPLLAELLSKMKTQLMRPRVLVSYEREPYVYAPGNVRITFDTDIRTTMYSRELLRTSHEEICALDSPNEMIMEVKYDDFLPEIISDIIQTEGLQKQAFSKYGICRRFG